MRGWANGSGMAIAACLAAGVAHGQPAPQRMALILGNADYDRDGALRTAPTDHPAPGRWRDLKNPCRDAALVKARLLAAQWREEEIVAPPCNLTADEMRQHITAFRERIANAHNTLAVLYYSGHGAQFANADTSHSFLFGVDAEVDLNRVADSLRANPTNTSFVATKAVDLHEFISTLGRQTENAVLVILDACRDNPVLDQIRDLEGAPAIMALSANAQEFTGIVVAYSTSAGAYASDGFGDGSIYTRALTDQFAPGRPLDSVLNRVRGAVAAAYRQAYPNRLSIQEPATRGRFTSDWCVHSCPPEPELAPLVASADLPPERNTVLAEAAADTFRLLASQDEPEVAAAGPAAAAAISQARPQVVYSLDGGRAAAAKASDPGMRFDIFWCDGGPGAGAREARANALATALAQEAEGRQVGRQFKAVGRAGQRLSQTIASVTVKQLTAEANAGPEFRYARDAVIYDAGDPAEIEWSKFAAFSSGFTVLPQAAAARTSGYISIVICRAEPPPTRTRIFLQAPSETLEPQGRALLTQLVADIPTVTAARGIEMRPDGPDRTEIRFYHPEDRDNVFQAAALMERLTARDVVVRYMSKYTATTQPGQMEIWLGKDDGGG